MKPRIKVLKRDKTLEEFNPKKIARVVHAAGLTEQQATKLAQTVANWVSNLGDEQISTLQIRDKVVRELKNVNKYAANLFEWYEKTKER